MKALFIGIPLKVNDVTLGPLVLFCFVFWFFVVVNFLFCFHFCFCGFIGEKSIHLNFNQDVNKDFSDPTVRFLVAYQTTEKVVSYGVIVQRNSVIIPQDVQIQQQKQPPVIPQQRTEVGYVQVRKNII